MALKNEVDYCSRSPNEEAAFEFFRIEYSAVIMYCFIFLICWKSRVVRFKKKKKKLSPEWIETVCCLNKENDQY